MYLLFGFLDPSTTGKEFKDGVAFQVVAADSRSLIVSRFSQLICSGEAGGERASESRTRDLGCPKS